MTKVKQNKFARPHLAWLRDGLRDSGKTKAGLARALKVSPSQVTMLLKGERRIRLDELPIIARYIGKSPLDELAPSTTETQGDPGKGGKNLLWEIKCLEGENAELHRKVDDLERAVIRLTVENVRLKAQSSAKVPQT